MNEYWNMNVCNTIQFTSLIVVTKFLLQSSFRNPIKFYYIWIADYVSAIMGFKTFDDWVLYYELVFYTCDCDNE
jgi:hypothetical protein